jgi:TonB-dependent receptor
VDTIILNLKLSINTDLSTNDLLPSLGLNFALNAKHTLRFGFTKTLSRPDFKELSPARFLNDDDNIYERGNPDLVPASITNFDFRWDWYPTSKELISVGLFVKNFENPIEAYAVNSTDSIRSYRNISQATNSGIEFELRKDITQFIGAGFNTEIFSNYSLIASQVNLTAEEKGDSTSFERPLQGQSPYLLNFGIDINMPWYDLNSTLVYNVVGERITDVGDGGRPDTYEEPIHQLDLSIVQKIKKNLNLTFRAQNLLDPKVTRTQGDFTVSGFQRGRVLSLGLSAIF